MLTSKKTENGRKILACSCGSRFLEIQKEIDIGFVRDKCPRCLPYLTPTRPKPIILIQEKRKLGRYSRVFNDDLILVQMRHEHKVLGIAVRVLAEKYRCHFTTISLWLDPTGERLKRKLRYGSQDKQKTPHSKKKVSQKVSKNGNN